MGYREVAPSPHLRSLVAGVWAFASNPQPHPHRVLPDGCIDLVVLGGRARVVGAMEQAIVVAASPEPVMGVRFRPGEAARLFPSLAELTDGDAPLADLWGDDGRQLEDALLAALDAAASASSILARAAPIIEAALGRRLSAHARPADPRTRAATALLGEGVPIWRVATELGVSERQLSRAFSERVGLGPKTFARVRRLQRAALLLQQGAAPGDAAASAGYADQPHFTRETRSLAGVTPAALAAEVRDGERHGRSPSRSDRRPMVQPSQSGVIQVLLQARPRDIGGFAVRRALPSMRRRQIGPFVFLDHMGPAELPPGSGMDVPPHPHIGLATLTYLFDGEIDHRDSLGSFQTIRPGDVNWMLAGRGIVHSERSGAESRARSTRVHGMQSWVALPLEHEVAEPRFEHHPAATIPRVVRPGVTLSVIAGSAYSELSPVRVLSATLYVHAQIDAGALFPVDDSHEERGIYVVEGAVGCEGTSLQAGTLAVLRSGVGVTLTAEGAARVMIVGGARLAGERHIEWNFVSSSTERIEQAKRDWKERRFPTVPGDEIEYVPLPEPRP